MGNGKKNLLIRWLIGLLGFGITLLLSFLLATGCSGNPDVGNFLGKEDRNSEQKESLEFQQFTEELFQNRVLSDSITLHYTLAKPENFGIKELEPTLGEYSEDSWQQDVEGAKRALLRLRQFEYQNLTREEQLCWDVLKDHLEQTVAGEAFFMLEGVLSPTTGLQAQLPILLAEYKFYDKEDIREYLEILACVPGYYQQILEVEKSRADAGYGMVKPVLEGIIAQCRDFVKEPEKNFLIETFQARLEGLSGASEVLDEDESLAFEYENKRQVLEHLIPAYENMIGELTLLLAETEEEPEQTPEGKAYYEWLVRSSTGSNWTVTEMAERLEKLLAGELAKMEETYRKNPGVMNLAMEPDWPEQNPVEILEYLQEAMREDYPEIEDADYQVKYVDPSLQEHLSPAFFLTPALDDWEGLSIYINEDREKGGLDLLFPTLAHEGFPGHLYETLYFHQSEPLPIRQVLPSSGYTEGWATYAEYESYEYAGFSEELAEFLRASDLAVLAVCGRADIGIHYEGWDLAETYGYLASHGLAGKEEDAKGLYWSCVAEPAATLDYVIGYLEFWELRNQAESEWKEENPGEEFPLKEYHEKLLGLGPAPFDDLEKWIFGRE